MAIYNVKIVDDAGASTTQPIGASSDNVLIQDENINLTQKLENINADRDALLEQIKKVESRHFTINKHIDSTNVPAYYGCYKIAKLPDEDIFILGTEWLINVNENVTVVAEMEDGGEASYTVATTSKILFKDGKFTLISFDNELYLSDELKEQFGTPPDSMELYYLNRIWHDNNSIYLYGMPYSYLFENSPLSFVDIGVTFLELSNSSSISLGKVDFEFIDEEDSNQIDIVNSTVLSPAAINKDTSSSFSIDTYEDEGVSKGWYKIAYYDYGNYLEGDCLISVKAWGRYAPQNFNFLLTGAQKADSYNFIPISQTLYEEGDSIVIDKIGFLYYQGCSYIAIHVSTGMQTWSCTATINNLNFAQSVPNNTYYNEQTLWVAPNEPFGYIGENGGYRIDAEYEIPNQNFYPLTSLNSGGSQFTVKLNGADFTYPEIEDPNGYCWYRIAQYSARPASPFSISIAECTSGAQSYLESQSYHLSPNGSNFISISSEKSFNDTYSTAPIIGASRLMYDEEANVTYLDVGGSASMPYGKLIAAITITNLGESPVINGEGGSKWKPVQPFVVDDSSNSESRLSGGFEGRVGAGGGLVLGNGRAEGGGVSEGSDTYASNYGHAEGIFTFAGQGAHAEGCNTYAGGQYSHAEGRWTKTDGLGGYSHAEGTNTTALRTASHAEGYKTTTLGYYSHAEGSSSNTKESVTTSTKDSDILTAWKTTKFALASGQASHVEGVDCLALGDGSHAEGSSTLTQANCDHAEGFCTVAKGGHSHAEGHRTTAGGGCSHAEGYITTASNYASHTSGKYNKAMVDGGGTDNQVGDVFVIGNGTSASALSNAFRVTYTGETYGLSAFNSSGADYAEFVYPWYDDNTDNEDRVGYFVTFKDGKLYKATSKDIILGITSGNPSIVGNADEDYYWKYERDEFNRIIFEDIEEEIEKVDEDGNPVLDENGNHIYEKTGNIIKNGRMKLNADYDPSLQNSYIERKNRAEWDYVGMLGVLPVRDDGTCIPGQYCKCNDEGIATAASAQDVITNRFTYIVLERVNNNIIKVKM